MSKSLMPPRRLYLEDIKSSAALTEKEKEYILKLDEEVSRQPLSLKQKLAQIERAEAERERRLKNNS